MSAVDVIRTTHPDGRRDVRILAPPAIQGVRDPATIARAGGKELSPQDEIALLRDRLREIEEEQERDKIVMKTMMNVAISIVRLLIMQNGGGKDGDEVVLPHELLRGSEGVRIGAAEAADGSGVVVKLTPRADAPIVGRVM